MKEQDAYILWLPSWYPNRREPFSGDFIQRHARAASLYAPITVVFFTQYGASQAVDFEVEEKATGNLRELIVYVPYQPRHLPFLDKLLYNLSFYSFAKKYLKAFFARQGLPRLVHVHVPVKAGNLAFWIKKQYGIPYLLSEQASTYLETAPDFFYKRHWLYRHQVKKIFRHAAWVTNVSAAVGAIFKKIFGITNLTVIHNTVDTGIFSYVANKSQTFTYIHVSSLSAQKNILGILRTFHRLSAIRKDWQLVVAGPVTKELEDFVLQNSLQDQLRFMGEVAYDQVAKLMQQANAFVLFSRHENFPCVVVEALCCGLPVVASEVAGIPEAVDHTNGLLLPEGDEAALLAALQEIRDGYQRYNRKLIAAEAQKKFSYPVIGGQFAELYNQIISRYKTPA